jgi:hypothetical protein
MSRLTTAERRPPLLARRYTLVLDRIATTTGTPQAIGDLLERAAGLLALRGWTPAPAPPRPGDRIGVNLNLDYAKLAHWRVWKSGDAHKVASRARNRPVRPLDRQPLGQGRLPL